MGAAKRAGTFEERKARAIARNLAFEQELVSDPTKVHPSITKYHKKRGTNSLFMAMLCMGMIHKK